MNLNQSNQNTQTAVNRIQNSLNKLQTTINNKTTNMAHRPKNFNIRKKILDTRNDFDKKNDDMLITDINIKHQAPIGYSMFNNNSMIQTDKRISKKPYEQSDLITKDNLDNNTSDNIPKTLQNRNIKYNKPTPNNNYNPNIKWKCLNCGNINLLYNNFCINCGSSKKNKVKNALLNNLNYSGENTNNNFNNFVNSNNSHEKFNTELNINNSNIISNSNVSSNSRVEFNIPIKQYNMKYSYNNTNINDSATIPNKEYRTHDNKIKGFNSWMGVIIPDKKTSTINNEYKTINISNYLDDLNNDINNYNINYKKLNDLYLYGDYLENELKESNDENVKLLEKYKNIKNEVHILNKKNKKIKENIEELQKKEGQLNKLNEQLKNGFPMLKSKLAKELNFTDKENNENKNIIKELELKIRQGIEKQKNYDNEIENLKHKITLLVNEKEDVEDEKNIKNLENQIEKEKNEMTENNNKYILLLNNNETLNSEINDLKDKIELMKPSKDENKTEEENDEDDPIQKKEELSKQINLYDKEINKNKKIMEDLVEEFKKMKNNENKDDDDGNDNDDDQDKNEYLEFKAKNNKLTNELLKLKEMTKNLSESKDKIIEIYEDEMAKLNNFYLKAKEKTAINDEEEDEDIDEEKLEEKLMKIISENEEIKNNNFELIKDLDQLAELQKIYQVLIDENKKLKINLSQSELDEGNQKLLKDIINEENLIDEEANDDNN